MDTPATPHYEETTLPPRVARAIEYYIDHRDAARASFEAGITDRSFVNLLAGNESIKKIVEDKLRIVDLAQAHARAAARVLTPDKLDLELVAVLNDKDAKNMPAKVRALEIGYKRFGMLTEKRELSGAGGEPMTFEIVRLGQKKEAPATAALPAAAAVALDEL